MPKTTGGIILKTERMNLLAHKIIYGWIAIRTLFLLNYLKLIQR